MTIRNLNFTLAPASIALVGASERAGSIGRVVLENVRSTFQGAILPVNVKYDEVMGLRCYRRVAELPQIPDVAIIMTPAPTVPVLVTELGARGCKIVVVLSAGIGSGNGLRQAMLDAARPHMLRIIGPNTIGLIAPRVGLNASFAHIAPKRGRLGLISQSGAIVSSMIDWAVAENVGFSQIYSLGDMADVDVGDCLDQLALDDQTDAVLLYLESIPHPRKFMSAARAASRIKPVIAVRPGRHVEAAQAAATHTGALAGADRVVDAVLHRAGIIRVTDLEDLFDAAEVTGRYRPLMRARTAIVTNGGGAGVLAVDELLDRNASLATLAPDTLQKLDAALPSTWSHANPVDIIGDAPPDRYRTSVELVAADQAVDALLVMNCPTAVADPLAAANAIAGLTERGTINGKPVLACWLGKHAAEPARSVLNAAGIGSFDTPAHAAQAISLLTRWNVLRTQLEQVPSQDGEVVIDASAISRTLASAASEERRLLTEIESKAVLAACGIDAPRTVLCATEDEVEAAATEMLTMVPAIVVKMMSKQVSHKSDIGGVTLNLTSAGDAAAAAGAIRKRYEAAHSEPLDGFTVQPMIRHQHGIELIAGLNNDPQFGPVIVFGAGGTSVEVVDDTAVGIAPLDAVLAESIIDKTRVSRLLAGYRDVPPSDRAAIARVLVALSELAIAFPAIVSVDVNPLVASAEGVIALDARIEIDPSKPTTPSVNSALLLRPYPSKEAATVETGGNRYIIRPIRPADAALYPAFLRHMDPEDMRRRFLVPTSTLSHATLIRLTQLDYDRDIAFVALDRSDGDLAAVVRYSTDPDHVEAEFGVLVRSDLKGRGLGRMMMQRLIDFARREGVAELVGLVLPDNTRMLRLCRELGFAVDELVPGENLIRASLNLSPP